MKLAAEYKSTMRMYTIGFILSLLLTGLAFAAVQDEWANGWALISVLAVLAVTQLLVQLFFFLHLSAEQKPRWKTTSLLFAGMVIVIIVFGSLWIMKNLNYDHSNGQPTSKPATKPDHEIIHDEGYKK